LSLIEGVLGLQVYSRGSTRVCHRAIMILKGCSRVIHCGCEIL